MMTPCAAPTAAPTTPGTTKAHIPRDADVERLLRQAVEVQRDAGVVRQLLLERGDVGVVFSAGHAVPI